MSIPKRKMLLAPVLAVTLALLLFGATASLPPAQVASKSPVQPSVASTQPNLEQTQGSSYWTNSPTPVLSATPRTGSYTATTTQTPIPTPPPTAATPTDTDMQSPVPSVVPTPAPTLRITVPSTAPTATPMPMPTPSAMMPPEVLPSAVPSPAPMPAAASASFGGFITVLFVLAAVAIGIVSIRIFREKSD